MSTYTLKFLNILEAQLKQIKVYKNTPSPQSKELGVKFNVTFVLQSIVYQF